MENLNSAVTVLCHLMFITMTHQLLRQLFDWSKIIKNSSKNVGRLKVFILFLSIAIGYLVSHFFLEVTAMSQSLLLNFQ